MTFKLVPHWTIKSASQQALLTYWDRLAAGRRFPSFAELKPDPGLHDPKQLVVWNIEGEGRLRKFRALYQGENIAEAFNSAWAGKTMEQVVPMSLRKLTLEPAKECGRAAAPSTRSSPPSMPATHGSIAIACCCRSAGTAARSNSCSLRCN